MVAKRPRWMIVVPVVAVVLIAAGVIGVMVAIPTFASFGWFAYAPLSGTVFSPDGAIVVSWGAIAGASVVALGLIVLAFWAGLLAATSRAKGSR